MASYEVSAELDGIDQDVLDVTPFVELCEDVLAAEGIEDAGVGLLFGADDLLRRLNRQHRDLDESTDVLSFPDDGGAYPQNSDHVPRYLGDIAVSVETAARQASELGLTVEEELQHLILHGLLHLLNYGHETDSQESQMLLREEAVLGPRIHAGHSGEEHEKHD